MMVLDALIRLQKIDTEIMGIEASLGELPRRVQELQHKIETTSRIYQEIRGELESFIHERLRLEGENQLIGEKLKKYQEQVYSVTTNKEYDAISAEIENSEKLIEDSETRVLDLMEKEEQHTERCNELEGRIKQLNVELHGVEHELSEKRKETAGAIQALNSQRATYTDKLSKSLYTNYERIRSKKNGIALANVEDYKCMECFGIIPAQTVVELRKRDRIILCETCGRILFVEDSFDDNK
ncbi:hypothetical protein JXB12_00115 [candidate division KSB1 bacterium]|nr:hypothetical protein [candidate division KSB1 bacterium]